MTPAPLRAVLVLREGAAEDARSALGRALEVEEEARRRCEAVRSLATAHARGVSEARRGLDAGCSDAGALLALSRLLERFRSEALEIESALRASDEALRSAMSAVERGRDRLAAARRALRDAERRLEGWRKERRRDVERRMEDDAEDVVTARRAARWSAPARTRW